MQPIPPAPAGSNIIKSQGILRFEDITQDRRLNLLGLPQLLDAVWEEAYSDPTLMASAHNHQMIPILTRMILHGTGESFPVKTPQVGACAYELSHASLREGEAPRIFLNMWADVEGTRGSVYPPHPKGSGEQAASARIFAEHIFTRPFGKAGERQVNSIPGIGVPPAVYGYVHPKRTLDLPEGATPLDDTLRPHPLPIQFGVMHTDSNHHVNSLAYPRIFQEALLHRAYEHGIQSGLLAQRVEVAWTKPCFAGQRVTLSLQSFKLGDEIGAVGTFTPEGGSRPHCYVRMCLAEGK